MNRWAYGISLFALALAAGPAWAQEAGNPSPPTAVPAAQAVGEVVVTARRRAERLQDVPMSVSAVTPQQINALNLNDLVGIERLPGVSTTTINGRSTYGVDIRGQGAGSGTDSAVVQYFAEVPNFPIAAFDLDNVQVLKGPQGTLFGETSTGGALLWSPTKPGNNYGGYIDLQGGDYSFKQLQAAINLPIIPDKLLFRAAVKYRYRAGFIETYFPNGQPPTDMANDDFRQIRLSLTWRPTDRIESYTMYSYSRVATHGTGQALLYVDPQFSPVANYPVSFFPGFAFYGGYAPPAGATWGSLQQAALAKQLAAGPYVSFTDSNQDAVTTDHALVNQTQWRITDHINFKNIVSVFWESNVGSGYELDGSDLPLLDNRALVTPGSTNNYDPQGQITTGGWPARTITEEPRLFGDLMHGRLQWQTGIYLRENGDRQFQETDSQLIFAAPNGDPASTAECASLNAPSPCATMTRTIGKEWAVYGQATYEVIKNLHFTAGYRRTYEYNRTDTTATTPYSVMSNGQTYYLPAGGSSPLPGALIASETVPWTAGNSYTLSLDYRVDPSLMVYVTSRLGFKGGGINPFVLPGNPHQLYGPETLQDVEVGAKGNWDVNGMRIVANLDVFQSWYDNVQRDTLLPPATELTENIASESIKGVEFEGSFKPVSWFDISGNFTYLDARYTDWTELSSCGSLTYLPQCAGSTAPVTIDHAHGVLTIQGQSPIDFSPDVPSSAPKWAWTISPELLLKQFLGGEDVSISANIVHRDKVVSGFTAATTSGYAGVTLPIENTLIGPFNQPGPVPGFTTVDLRADWRHVLGRPLTLSVVVTNLTNTLYYQGQSSPFNTLGYETAIFAPPRMWYMELNYEF